MHHIHTALAQLRRTPILWWLPLGMALVSHLLGASLSARIFQTMPHDLGGFGLLMFAMLFALPAAASGYNAVVGRAVALEDEPVGIGTFLGNLGTYYWRIVGGALLLGLAMIPLSLIGGGCVPGTNMATNNLGNGALGALMILVGEVWFAAMVLSGVGTIDAVSRGLRSLAANFADYALPLALSFLASWVLPRLLTPAPTVQPGMPIDPGAFFGIGTLLLAIVGALVGAVVRVAVFQIYRDRTLAQLAPMGPGQSGDAGDVPPPPGGPVF